MSFTEADRPRSLAARRGAWAALALTLLAAACSSDTAPSSAAREIDGPDVAVGQGTAHTFVLEGGDGVSSVGVALAPSALDGLPTTDAEWALPLPSGVSVPPWDHATLDWNAQGHPPAVYQTPHFDFHFYAIDAATQASIQGGPDTVTVPAANVPQDYASGVMAVPDMGVHWVDTLAAEFRGEPFDHTLIYGFYRGSMVFVEPMVTRSFLAGRPDVTAPVKQPAAFARSGRYPTWYSVRTGTDGELRVALDSLRAR